MGAAVAIEIAGLFGDRIERVVAIDAFAHHEGGAAEAIAANREAIEHMLSGHGTPRVFSGVDEMVTRVTQATDRSRDAAAILLRAAIGWRAAGTPGAPIRASASARQVG